MKTPLREGRSWLIGWPERVGYILIGLTNIVHTVPGLKIWLGRHSHFVTFESERWPSNTKQSSVKWLEHNKEWINEPSKLLFCSLTGFIHYFLIMASFEKLWRLQPSSTTLSRPAAIQRLGIATTCIFNANESLYVTGFAKRGLVHASNFVTSRMYNSAHVWPTTLKFGTCLSYHCGYTRENFSLIAHSQMKLCLFKVAKSDACIRPLFANPVTYV